MKLPEAFLERMERLLEGDMAAFLESYHEERLYGLRVNTLKISVEAFLKITPFHLTPIPWTRDGFYYNEEDKPTKHPHYYAGLYYIQEPSAMAPVNVLTPEATDIVLDMCACPGGKSIQIASYLGEQGLLISNDVSASRIKALVKNVELMGIRNVLILNTTEEIIGNRFNNVFDKLLVDAPCSGEGMFRKDPKMSLEWRPEEPERYRVIQENILNHIQASLKPGGVLVYSTCTFSPEENEACLESFMENHADFKLSPLTSEDYEFAAPSGYGRLWPHRLKGEGHFVAKLKKEGEQASRIKSLQPNSPPEAFGKFMEENFIVPLTGHFEQIKDQLYLKPPFDIDLKGIRVARTGLLLGEIKGKNFVPSQALAMAVTAADIKRTLNLSSESVDVIKYLKGETLFGEGENGLTLICVDGYPLGWGKMNNNTLKNMYASAWRLL